jgi:hypothetical protein
MNIKMRLSVLTAFTLASASWSAGLYAAQHHGGTQNKMSFFVTSAGSGNGADLGGLAGADKHCQSLAQTAGAGKRTWRAYLSTSASGGAKAVNASSRIGRGPWYNASGVLIARNVDQLHDNGNLTKETILTEKGGVVNGRGDKPNMHDILTGSDPQGRAFPAGKDTTCGNWTKSGDGSAQVGHSDRQGLREDVAAKSWNDSHPSRGCSQENLRSTGGNGFFYCFAVK